MGNISHWEGIECTETINSNAIYKFNAYKTANIKLYRYYTENSTHSN
jgi:hypothetical protein